MQLSKEEQTKLDTIIERYMDDTTSKEAKAIENYLNKINSLERELLITVYFNFSRKATDEENKIKRLSQFKKLTEVITLLHNRLYSLELELKTYDSVTTSSVNNEKVNTSKQSYNFGSFKISSEIDEVKEIIQSKTIEWEKEREFLKDVFEQIKDVKEQHIFYLRYINCLQWNEIALKFDKSEVWCKRIHTRNIKVLKL